MFRIPTVLTAQELLDGAFRRAKKARGRGRAPLEKSRNGSLSRISAFSDGLDAALRRIPHSFPNLDSLDPFYRELVDLTAGIEELRSTLAAVQWTANKARALAQEARRAVRDAGTVAQVEQARKAFYGRVSSLVKDLDEALQFLNAARYNWKSLPVVDPRQPTLVVAGAPNVGKSQLVRAVSSSRPKVATYPFTTQALSVGHLVLDGTPLQILDTPGLLDRPIHERNPFERQALLALSHLATLILFLLDPTETCGYPLAQQERLLQEVRALYPHTGVLEVENKADLGGEPGERLRISALTGQGTDALLARVKDLLTSPAPEDAPPSGAH